ncbi:COP9 signalosome complex subunit 7 [Glycine soja]
MQWSLVSVPRDLLLITGKALTHATTGLCPVASYRASPDYFLSPNGGGRTCLAYRLMPQGNAILDCSPIEAAGHEIETLKMQKKQSKVMELVKQASASPNANALTSILVQATSHPNVFSFSQFLALPNLLEKLQT